MDTLVKPNVTASDTLLTVEHVSHSYGKDTQHPILKDANLALKENEIVSLLGRSGSGKSTLLRIIAGLTTPTEGSVVLGGQAVNGPPDGVAMVFQSFALLPWLTVLANVELGLEAQGVPPEDRRRRALAAIDLIGLDGFENAYPKEISGGMRQRVGFARALVTNPKLLLMDEPFSALDVLTAETLRTDLLDLWVEGRLPIKAILLVTHNIEEAVLMSDRILLLSSNPGTIAAEFKVSLPQPRNRFDPTFRALVDDIYKRMTARSEANKPGVFAGLGMGMVLPRVSSNALSGLTEALVAAPYEGRADLPVLVNIEADQLLRLAEMLQLLRFAELAEGDIKLTDAGRRFAGLGVDDRKALFRQHLITHVPIVAHIRRVLDERPTHRAPVARFQDELEDYMDEETAKETLRAVVSLARYGEVFAFDKEANTFSLDNPS
ncbi:MAG TPA: nitrate/sulfonate/bicarbonate ABC transporter ATP-binding protein [Hyphomicrobium sp.]|nr:nitrate/sulfonate/bicarbonate ABC transporter ATP-binding protein [Hyphomicrobium sp.]